MSFTLELIFGHQYVKGVDKMRNNFMALATCVKLFWTKA